MGAFDDLIPTEPTPGTFDDLIPKQTGGAFDDLIPPPKKMGGRDQFDSELKAGPPEGKWASAVETTVDWVTPGFAKPWVAPWIAPLVEKAKHPREALTPLIGPSAEQVERESVLMADGSLQYKPLGSAVEREGFFGAAGHPIVPLDAVKAQAKPGDGTATAIGKGVWNTAVGFAEFAESPLGLATAGVGALAGVAGQTARAIRAGQASAATPEIAEAVRLTGNLGRAVAGGYATDMAIKTPDAYRAADESLAAYLRGEGTTQDAVEPLLQLGVNAVLVPTLARHAAGGHGAVKMRRDAPEVILERPLDRVLISEFGGEQKLEATRFEPISNAEQRTANAEAPGELQTSNSKLETSAAGLFDDLIPPKQTTVLADREMHPVLEVPLNELALSKEVPNFKADADVETGVVAGQKLEGKYERLGTGAITVWERADGSKEVISGRHRFDLAKRAGEETIPAQIVREADGFTKDMAMTLDAEMNIRDGQGAVGDYANYFRHADITPEQAAERGLVSRAKGKAGWAIGRNLTDDAFALYRAGKMTEPQAVAVGTAAPGDAALQRVGVKAALDGKSPQEIGNFIQAVKLETRHLPPEQFDLFAADESALKEAERLASIASRIQTELSREIRATDNAAKAAVTAKARGIAFERPPEEILAENAALKTERDRWDNWSLHKEMIDQVRGYAEMDRRSQAKYSLDVNESEKAAPSSRKSSPPGGQLADEHSVLSAAEKRAGIIPIIEREIADVKNKRDQEIEVKEDGNHEDGEPGTWSVYHPEAENSWSVYEDNGQWRAENDGSYTQRRATREEAIEDAKARLRDEINDSRGTFGSDMDNQTAVQELFDHFDIPPDASQTGWERTKWGSWYNTVTLEDGTNLKLSVRDHDASRKDMGLPDITGEVSKNWAPREVADALSRIERRLFKKANAELSPGVAGIKPKSDNFGEADKSKMSALQTGQGSALTPETELQHPNPVKPSNEPLRGSSSAPKFSLEGQGDKGRLPNDGTRYTEPQILEATERLKNSVAARFKSPEMAARIRRIRAIAPDLRDAATEKATGISAEIQSAFEKAFGLKIVFLDGKERLPFNGVRHSEAPGLLFIDVRASQPALVIAGHELLHELRGQSPQLYKGLEQHLMELVRELPHYRERMDALYGSKGLEKLSDAALREELIADFFGDQMARESFWRKLEQRNAPLFEKLATATLNFLQRVKERFWGVKSQSGAQASFYFNHLERAQEIVAAALNSYAQARGTGGARDAQFQFSIAPETAPRQFGEKVKASEDISDTVKAGVSEYNYTPRSNETDLQTAQRIIAERGIDNAIADFKHPPVAMPGAVQSALGKTLILEMAKAEKLARLTGDTATSEALVNKQVDLIDHELKRSTEIAQSLQAMRLFGDMSPSAIVRTAKRTLEGAGKKAMERVRPTLDAIRNDLRRANEQAVDETIHSREVNRAAREAVDEQIVQSAETHRAIVMELAEPFAQSPVILGHAREAVRAKVNELLNKAPRPPGLSASQHHRIILNELAARAASIANSHYQGAEPGVTLRDKFMGRMGITEAHATRLAKQFDAEFTKMVERAKGKLKERIAMQRARRELNATPEAQVRQSRSVWSREKQAASETLVRALKGSGAAEKTALQEFAGRITARLREQLVGKGKAAKAKLTDLQVLSEAIENADKYQEVWEQALADIQRQFGPEAVEGLDPLAQVFSVGRVDRVLRGQLREMNLKLGDVVKQTAAEVDAAGRTLGDRIVQASGLKGASADALRAAFDRRFKTAATEAKRRALEGMANKGMRVPRKIRAEYEKFIELTNLGAFDDARFFDLAAKTLKIPTMTKEIAAEVTRRANDLQAKPDGFQKQRAILELHDYIARQRGLEWHDLPMAFWYANILSGPTTHFVNSISNVYNLSANIALQMARHPFHTPEILSALARGIEKGGLEAAAVLKTGYVTGTKLTKFGESRPLELKQFTGWATPLNAWRYVGRALSAEDLLFFKAAEEMKAATAARLIAKREGLTGPALKQRVANILGTLDAQVSAAEAQAHKEGLTGLDFRRRVAEILEQARPEELQTNALEYALKVTFNNEPYGVLGAIARGIDSMHERTVVTRFAVPFTTIVSNVVNESMNYLPPVAAARAIWGHWKGTLDGKPIADREMLYDQWAKAAIGTALLSAVAIAQAKTINDDDPVFAIYGSGPRTGDQRDQLKAAGWRPYSFKIGKRYISFANTPAAIPLAVMGNYFDAIRYKDLDKTDALNRVSYALLGAGKVILETSFLDSAARIIDMVKRDSTKKSGAMLAEFASRTGGSFVIPNALKQVDRIFDPTVYDGATVQAGLVNQVPFVRAANKPALNVWGEPVKAPVSSRFVSEQKPDALMQLLARKQIWIPVPDRDQVVVGSKSWGEGHYRMLTPDEFYEYVRVSGQAIRKQLESRQEQLAKMQDAHARKLVLQIVEMERQRARLRFKM